jgi:Cu/Ag efflux pump CusA
MSAQAGPISFRFRDAVPVILNLSFATGSGADIQKPLAMVVNGGLLRSTLLTLLVLPVVFAWWEGYDGREERRCAA